MVSHVRLLVDRFGRLCPVHEDDIAQPAEPYGANASPVSCDVEKEP